MAKLLRLRNSHQASVSSWLLKRLIRMLPIGYMTQTDAQ
jgi:hypothetical protein